MGQNQQIFQTDSPSRWRRVKWTSRVLVMIGIFFLAVLVLAVIRGYNPSLPNLEARARAYEKKLDPANPLTLTTTRNKKYKGFKDFLDKKVREDSIVNSRKLSKVNTVAAKYIRAAFYTPWKPNSPSYQALEKYGDHLNTIFPEWFFIDIKGNNQLDVRIDTAGLSLMRQYKLDVLPMLSNFSSAKRDFDGNLIHPILTNPSIRKKFIADLIDTLQLYHLQGVNIDFEELTEPNNGTLTGFQKELFEAFHEKSLLVTMDVVPKNEDYDLKALSEFNDYIVLMAYDQFNNSTGPGPISDQKWIEEMLDWASDRMDPSKIILGVAAFGYDWTVDDNGNQLKKHTVESVTYFDAINKAKVVNADIDYDNNNYNLNYGYIESGLNDDGVLEKSKHEVWFTDAATTFNILRFSDNYTTAGTALWRLGSEDARLWDFYDRDLSNGGIKASPYDYSRLATIPVLPDNVSRVGEGELLNILYPPQEGRIKIEVDSSEQLIAEQEYTQLPLGYVIEKFAEDTTEGPGHKLILTFDDGPDSRWTPEILDILERYKVPATFFVVGIQAEKNIPILQRIYRDGYEIGNHTFTHSNLAKMSGQRAELEMKLTRLLIESVTGRSTVLFRAPYNADSEPHTFEELEPIARSHKDNYITVGESIDPNDWVPGISADSIVARTIRQILERNASIVLLHDAGGDSRRATIDALPRIIEYFKNRQYKFTTVADLMGKTKDDVMPKLPASRDTTLIKINFFLAEATYWGGQILFALFLVGIGLSIGRMIFVAVLAWLQKKREEKKRLSGLFALPAGGAPRVSIIIPAYNEEVNAVKTVESLLQQDYPNMEIIFVDDGSKDETYTRVEKAFLHVPNVHVYTKPNGGKASALNYGVQLSMTPFVVCIDADTQLKSDAVSLLMKKFFAVEKGSRRQVGAVAGNVKVGNEINMITRWQSIEYITAQNFDRRAFDLLNCITVVPGAIGAFRKDAIVEAGLFATDTLAEDCDLTMRLLRAGYRVTNCTEAISYTEAPETLRMFLKQRFRWSFGVMQSFWKHRDACFNPRYGNFGMIALPNILIFQMVLPFLAPLADLVLAISLIAAGLHVVDAGVLQIVWYYLIFTAVDIAGAAIAFAFEKERYRKLWWMLPQRFVYRQLMYYILIKSLRRAMKGELQDWGKLKRTGNVKQMAVS